MSEMTLIPIGVLLNVLCTWSLAIFIKGAKPAAWKECLKYLVGLPIGGALSLLFPVVSVSGTVLFALLGGISGELLALFFLTVKSAYRKESFASYYDDGSPNRFYITGDKHRRFDSVGRFCREMNTRRKDVLIVLGDAGFNYYGDDRDEKLKKEVSQFPITLLCLHGNKENRPQNVGSYGIKSFFGGKVYYEPGYPNLCFAIDGEIYTFEGRKYMAVGGAHSVDKLRCLEEGDPFWSDEMLNDATRKKAERRLQAQNNQIYGMLTHTCPIDYLPTEMFLSAKQPAGRKRRLFRKKPKKAFQADIDRSTEQWLGELEKKLDYRIWFCGHYHIDKQIDRIRMMYRDIRPLHLPIPEELP